MSTTPKWHIVSPWKNKLERAEGDQFKTLVFMKTNVTDLNDPRLTELAMVSVNCCDLANRGGGDNSRRFTLPRVNEKLVLFFDPMVPINTPNSAGSQLTLERLRLSDKRPFDDSAVHCIYQFLRHQTPPICMFAHNGFLVDFVTLKTELDSIGKTLLGTDSSSLFCADTMHIFKEMDTDGMFTSLDMVQYSLQNSYKSLTGNDPYALKRAEDHAICLWKIFNSRPAIMNNISTLRFCHSPARRRLRLDEENTRRNHNMTDFESRAQEEQCAGDTIQTYAFIDFETTGLDVNEDNIIEVCMIAVGRNELPFLANRDPKNLDWSEVIPPIADKICFQINPHVEVQEGAAAVNMLTAVDLRHRDKKYFTMETVTRMKTFLERLKKPICLVAHNGDRFDFPMLEAHLRRVNSVDPFWNNIFCADSIVGLRELGRTEYCGLQKVFSDLAGPDHKLDAPVHTAEGDVLRLIAVTTLFPGNLPQWFEQNKKNLGIEFTS